MEGLRFIDLFAGMGGFHLALSRLGHHCVFASELDEELQNLYLKNFPSMKGKVYGDIRRFKGNVPDHDILCAGFPCQPFSKSGDQLGSLDEIRGTLFREIIDIVVAKRPRFLLLENVGNFGRHDAGRTWHIVKRQLRNLGYHVEGTEHRTPIPTRDWRDIGGFSLGRGVIPPIGYKEQRQGSGLISPHHFGFPHHRERFYIVGSLDPLPDPAFPIRPSRTPEPRIHEVEQSDYELTALDRLETRLSPQQERCIEHWNELVTSLPQDVELPSFPLWGDELGARYPFERSTPWSVSASVLGACFEPPFPKYSRKEAMLPLLPSYAREEVARFREWKVRFIGQNRQWWAKASPYLPDQWAAKLRQLPPSHRKLEWNVKGGERNLWGYVLQFRPSGLRIKRYSTSPALIAMTATQIPVLGPKRRFITRIEGKRLQGFPDSHALPMSRDAAFRALGNAVHVGVIERLAAHLLGQTRVQEPVAQRTVAAVS